MHTYFLNVKFILATCLRPPGESEQEWDPSVQFRKIDFCLMYEQFCMVASITNFFNEKLHQVLHFLSLASPSEKFNRFLIAPFRWICPRKYFYPLVSRRKSVFWDEECRGSKKHGKRRPRGGNHTWLIFGFPPVITYTASEVTWFASSGPNI